MREAPHHGTDEHIKAVRVLLKENANTGETC
jgi:hypothetical protein